MIYLFYLDNENIVNPDSNYLFVLNYADIDMLANYLKIISIY